MADHNKFLEGKSENFIDELPKGSYRVEAPDNVEMGGKIDSIRLCKAPAWKTAIRFTSYACTGFIMYLLALWIPSLKIKLKYSDCNEDEAQWVLAYGADGSIDIVPFLREETSTSTMKAFVYRLFKYYYDENTRMFRPAQFTIEKFTNNKIHSELAHGLENGKVNDNGVLYGTNQTDIPKKSCVKLLFDEVLSPFYIFQVFSFVIWYLDDYTAYAIVICVFSAISITMSLIDTISTTNKLRKMSYYEIPVTVVRHVNGEQTRVNISSSDLVPGDLLIIPENVSMPCDAILINGSCIMNEAMLTGESIPVVKNALPHNDNFYSLKEDKQYTLYAGTKCIQARYYQGNAVLGLVTLTGFGTMKGELIRTMLFPKPSDFKFYADSFKFIGILAFMAVCGFLIDLPSFINAMHDDTYDASDLARTMIIKASEIVTVTVPPALPTCMQIGVSIALARLKKKQTYCISPTKINEAGRVNVMCFDKTGTLTEDGLDLLGVRPVNYNARRQKLGFAKLVRDPTSLVESQNKKREEELENYITMENQSNKNALYSTSQMLPSEQMLEIMASCHSLTLVQNKMIGDPLDLKMFEATNWQFEENEMNKFDSSIIAVVRQLDNTFNLNKSQHKSFNSKEEKGVGIVRRFDFSSKLQRMSAIVKHLSDTEFKIHMKGSPEKVRELCDPSSVPDNFHSILEKYTEEGYRVLACASKNVGTNYKSLMAAKREDLEFDLNFIGFLIMENKLKAVTTQIIDTLHSAEIRTIMVTGDNALTAISVARQCHIVGCNQRIFLGDISEQKVKGKNVIVWKDFEFSGAKLNDDLEPETDFDAQPLKALDPMESNSPVKKSSTAHAEQENLIVNSENDSPTLHGANLDYGLVDLDPPFFSLKGREEYCIAITGKAYSMILHEAEVNQDPKYLHILARLMNRCVVFARMHPDEKASMIAHMMQNRKNTVGMCGDGANDVGALKTANVGVSLSEAEASIAAPFTSKIQDISCIPTLLKEGRAALATSYQAFKFMALYSVIQFTSVTIMYYNIVEFTNWHYYHIDLGIILPISATMAMSQTYQHLTKFKPTGRLISVQILSSVLGQAVIQILFQLLAFGILTGTVPILREEISADPQMVELGKNYQCTFGGQTVCSENSTLYLVSIYQYLAVGLAFLVGKPFRKSFYTNFFFTGSLILLVLLNLLITYNPFNWGFIYAPHNNQDDGSFTINATLNFPTFYENTIVVIALINAAFTIFWERVVVKQVSLKWKQYRDSRDNAQEEQGSQYARAYQAPQEDTSMAKKMTELTLQL